MDPLSALNALIASRYMKHIVHFAPCLQSLDHPTSKKMIFTLIKLASGAFSLVSASHRAEQVIQTWPFCPRSNKYLIPLGSENIAIILTSNLESPNVFDPPLEKVLNWKTKFQTACINKIIFFSLEDIVLLWWKNGSFSALWHDVAAFDKDSLSGHLAAMPMAHVGICKTRPVHRYPEIEVDIGISLRATAAK